MKDVQVSAHIITSLDDIAWILNMRGWDIANYPVMLAYFIIEETRAYVFIDEGKLTSELKANFVSNQIEVRPYHDIYDFVKTLPHQNVLLNKAVVNYAIVHNLAKDVTIIDRPNPSQFMKAMKNDVEQSMNKVAHIKDGVAMTKFIYWLKSNVGKIPMSELSVQNKLYESLLDDEDNLTDLETNESEQLAQNTPAENLEQDVFDLNKQEPERSTLWILSRSPLRSSSAA